MVSGFANRAIEQVAHLKVTADILRRFLRALKAGRDSVGSNGHSLDAGKFRADFFRHAVAEIFIGRIAAQVLERKNCDRNLSWRRRSKTLAPPEVVDAGEGHENQE